MSSTYSDLKIELQATGENDTTWGTKTNTNLEALEEAIAESADVTFASGNVTLSFTDTSATQSARHLRLRCTGTTGGARNLVVPTIEKPYIVQNDCSDAITVKTSAGTGIAVPAGKTMVLYANGTNVVDAITHLSSLTVAGNVALGDATSDTHTFTGSTTITGATDASLTVSGAGAPMVINSSNSNVNKLQFKNAGSLVGNIGHNATNFTFSTGLEITGRVSATVDFYSTAAGTVANPNFQIANGTLSAVWGGSGAGGINNFGTFSAHDTVFVYNQTEKARVTSGGFVIGSSGSAISKVIQSYQSIDFGLIAANSTATVTAAVTGAAAGDLVIVTPADGGAGLAWQGYVSSADTITIQAFNHTTAGVNPAAQNTRIVVIKF